MAVLIMLQRFKEAVDVCNQALKLEPSSSKLHKCKGDCLYNLNRKIEAIAEYNRSHELSPTHDAMLMKSKALFALSRYTDAYYALVSALAISKSDEATELMHTILKHLVSIPTEPPFFPGSEFD